MDDNRFYPSNFPVIEGEPTRDKFAIAANNGQGEGVITKVPFKEGDLVFIFTGVVLPYQTLFTLQLDKETFIEDRYFMGKILHSCQPNLTCDMKTRTFTAARDIHPLEFLSMDYNSTEDILFRSFQCQCGEDNCKGWIEGKLATKDI